MMPVSWRCTLPKHGPQGSKKQAAAIGSAQALHMGRDAGWDMAGDVDAWYAVCLFIQGAVPVEGFGISRFVFCTSLLDVVLECF